MTSTTSISKSTSRYLAQGKREKDGSPIGNTGRESREDLVLLSINTITYYVALVAHSVILLPGGHQFATEKSVQDRAHQAGTRRAGAARQ